MDARIADVLELRAEVGPPAADLGTAAATLVQELDELRAELPVDPDQRRSVIEAVRTGVLADLAEAHARADVDVAGDGPDAAAVAGALRDARAAADALAAAADEDLAVLDRAADADVRLSAVVAAWVEPGSRSQQLARLEEAATRADALAAELGAAEDDPACAAVLARRTAAATTVADASRELHALVERRRGEEFDARRRELAQDPAASTRTLVDADRAGIDCWRAEAEPVELAAAVAEALEELERALNPADLASPSGR
ncbi:MAG: hypothetical protein KY457_14515 [Actinobacteria bacterium]|nr:hypothetical protein [Actinomycetota bacterium]